MRKDPSVSTLNRPLIIFYILIFYIFASFLWWSYLLLANSRQQHELTRRIMIMENQGQDLSPAHMAKLEDLNRKYQRQVWMIIGEGIVFFALITLAALRIRQSYRRELELARQQRNFLLSITHELKSPLASIRLGTETILKRELPRDKITGILNNSLEDADRLQALVEDILLAARFEDRQFVLARENLEITGLVEATATKVASQMGRNNDLIIRTHGEIIMQGDRQALVSVIANLVENACKYSPPDSKVEVSVENKNSHVRIEVADQGYGISSNEKQHIFKKFYRVGDEQVRTTRGTGLGLFIVKEAIEGHGGSVKIEDNLPKGSRFIIELPGQLTINN